MEPFSPPDPLHALLGKSKPVEPRANFSQNVLRAVRQLPQQETLRERLSRWISGLTEPSTALATAVAVGFVLMVISDGRMPSEARSGFFARHTSQDASLDAAGNPWEMIPTESEVASEVDGMNQLSALLAQQDTRALSDSDIAQLLY